LVIATWAVIFYFYCRIKELNDKVEFYQSRIDFYSVEKSGEHYLDTKMVEKVKRIDNRLDEYEAKFDYHHSVISSCCAAVELLQQSIHNHDKKILEIIKKIKKPKKETKPKKTEKSKTLLLLNNE